MNIQEAYQTLQKKHGLPSWAELDNELELLYINPIAEINYPLRFVRRRLNDKIAWACNMLQSLLQPNQSSVVNMTESGFFTKEEREQMMNILKRLMTVERTSLLLDIDFDENKDVAFIKENFQLYIDVKKELKETTEKLIASWNKEKAKTKENHYMG